MSLDPERDMSLFVAEFESGQKVEDWAHSEEDFKEQVLAVHDDEGDIENIESY